jgi:transposase InsO family protein
MMNEVVHQSQEAEAPAAQVHSRVQGRGGADRAHLGQERAARVSTPNCTRNTASVVSVCAADAPGLTYLWTTIGFVYLAVILDLYSRRVVGWNVSRDLDASVGLEAPTSAGDETGTLWIDPPQRPRHPLRVR